MLKAYSLLEVMIVMAIVAMTAGLGMYGFVSFRRSIQLTQALNEVIAITKETRSMAKNNVIPKSVVEQSNRFTGAPETLYAYRLLFTNNQMSRSLCSRTAGSSFNSWNCSIATPEQLKSTKIFGQIDYLTNELTACQDVIFENLTGEMKVRTLQSSTIFADVVCALKVRQQESGATREITFDGLSNTFTIKE